MKSQRTNEELNVFALLEVYKGPSSDSSGPFHIVSLYFEKNIPDAFVFISGAKHFRLVICTHKIGSFKLVNFIKIITEQQ